MERISHLFEAFGEEPLDKEELKYFEAMMDLDNDKSVKKGDFVKFTEILMQGMKETKSDISEEV